MKTCLIKTLGKYAGSDYTIELEEDTKPFRIPKIHKLEKRVNRLLKTIIKSQWSAPASIIPKINGTKRFISDFIELNRRLKT